MSIPADLVAILRGIRTAVLGEEVRNDIADGLQYVYESCEEFKDVAVLSAEAASGSADSAAQSASTAEDAAILVAEDIIAEEYDPTNDHYSVGDYRMHDGLLYKCIVEITEAEPWTSSHWLQVLVGGEIGDLKSAFGQDGIIITSWEQGRWADSDGSPVVTTNHIRTRDFIAVNQFSRTIKMLFNNVPFPQGATNFVGIIWEYSAVNPVTPVKATTVYYSNPIDVTLDDTTTHIRLGARYAPSNTYEVPVEYGELILSTWDGFGSIKYLDNKIIKPYVGSAPTTSVSELPDNVMYVGTGAIMQPLLGPNFIWELNATLDYLLTVRRIKSNYRRYDLSGMAGITYWSGGKRDDVADITWRTSYPDNTLTVDNVPANSKTVGDRLFSIDNCLKNVENAFELYTEFTLEAGWWNADGTLRNLTNQSHTQKLRVRPGATYYVSVLPSLTDVFCANFDAYGDFLGALSVENDLSEYNYNIPNGDPTSSATDYVKLYRFTVPDDVEYVSLNWIKTDPKKADVAYDDRFNIYRNYLSSKPIFALMNTGNYQIKADDATYQKYKGRKLCIIGSSPVMIDRLYRSGNNYEYVVGFQEYLAPWWSEVCSFGYSSASYRKYDVEDGASVRSIYSRVITDQLDLSGYDDYLLVANGNGVTGHIGTLTSYDDLGTATECMGGMRQIIDYIYQQNPDAMIYVQTMRYQGSWATTSRDTAVQLNNEIRKMAEMLSLGLVDNAYDSGINQYNSEQYSYDGGSHCNQIGNKIQGLCVRKAILGF